MIGIPSDAAPLMKVEHLRVSFHTPRATVHAVRDVSLTVRRGEILGLVGESGCGKSTVAFAMMGYFSDTAEVSGAIRFEGTDLTRASPSVLRDLRGNRIAMVYQDPAQSLSPNRRVGEQIEEVLKAHLAMSTREARNRVGELFYSVKLPDPGRIGRRYPHQLSGGQQQRVVIAMALACDPDLLVMDEPTTGLDVTTEASICDLILELKQRVNAGIVYVSHNLGVIAGTADRVVVMYAGQTVEEAQVRSLFKEPRHPYTVGLLACVPRHTTTVRDLRIPSIPGIVYPAEAEMAQACLFASRCPMAEDVCRAEAPVQLMVEADHWSRCFMSKDVRRDIWPREENRERPHRTEIESPLLEAKRLRRFHGGRLRKFLLFGPMMRDVIRAVMDIEFRVGAGRTLGVVGESGSGKTTVARMVVGLTPPTAGTLELRGKELAARVEDRSHGQRAALQMIFQNPTGSLNPKRPITHAILRSLRRISGLGRNEAQQRAAELLEAIGLDAALLNRKPGELSGGQQQRVALAGAFAVNPQLIVADEAVSSLDVSVQAQVLNLLDRYQSDTGTSYVFISHDLAVVRYLADDILVMCAGHVAEYGPADSVLESPSHPYTEALLSAVPVPDPDAPTTSHIRLEGVVPDLREPFKGCFFAGRCPRKIGAICDTTPPPARTGLKSSNHTIYCHISVEDLTEMQLRHGDESWHALASASSAPLPNGNSASAISEEKTPPWRV